MKIRSREINVFSMSALDLFASALGAFILISIVLMPYFLRVEPEEVARLRQALAEAQAAEAETRQRLDQVEVTLEQCRDREAECRREVEALRRDAESLQNCRAELNACEERLSSTFLLIVIQWATERHDVDLHVIDAAGEEFYYAQNTIPGREGELSEDTTRGPGIEIWEVVEAPVGDYQVLYNLYNNHGNSAPAVVRGAVYHRDGHTRFHQRSLTRQGRDNALEAAVVTVRDDGSVEISER